MNQQQNQSQSQQMLTESDYLNVMLSDLKRTAREYTTATTESACPVVRRMFVITSYSIHYTKLYEYLLSLILT